MRAIQGGILPDFDVSIDGSSLDPTINQNLLEIKVVDSLNLPDLCVIKFQDPGAKLADDAKFKIGAAVDVKMALGGRADTSVFKGEITSVSADFGRQGATFTVRAYDRLYKLQQKRGTKTFQQVKISDVVSRLAGEVGLQAQATSTSTVHEFIQMSDESYFDFLWRLARSVDFELAVDDRKLIFRRANNDNGAGAEEPLNYKESLIAFRPRMTKMQQFNDVEVRGWDPKSKRSIVATKPLNDGDMVARIGHQREKENTFQVGDRTVTVQGEADELAKATINKLANNYVEAEGTARGNPKLKAGVKVKVSGVGTKFGGTYVLSSVTHHLTGKKAYDTHFTISGRTPRTLLDLMNPSLPEQWGQQVVIGLVTNDNDPDNMGRVRVKYPSLSDTEESWWARVLFTGAGNNRGHFAMPTIDDEVAVMFENGDTRRPIVIGSLYNGKDKTPWPAADTKNGGKENKSHFVRSENNVKTFSVKEHELHSTKNFTIKSDADLVIEVKANEKETVSGNIESKATGNYTIKSSGNITVEATGQLQLKGMGVTVDGGASVVSIKGSQISLG